MSQLHKQGIMVNPHCPLCLDEEESLAHILFQCIQSQEI